MKILIDIGHPAHVHFFRHPIRLLKKRGHEIVVTSRDKEMALGLLDSLGLEHRPLSALGKGGVWSLGKELLTRNLSLLKVVREVRPDVMAGIGGIFIAQVSLLTRVPSLVFYDTENARLQNALTYPFASCVFAPRAYSAWLPKNRNVRYRGYHELSYLRPNVFNGDKSLAVANGLAEEQDTFLIRVVSWKANHDVGERGWSPRLLRKVVDKLSARGRVLISSERPLQGELARYAYAGDPAAIHHVMAFCRAFIGESATMASECAVLGVPAIYAAATGRGYTDEQESLYGLVENIRDVNWGQLEAAVDRLLSAPVAQWSNARQALLNDTIDVGAFVAASIEGFPAPLKKVQAEAAG